MNDAEELRRLNRITFEAEQNRERQPLEEILADDEFRIKRSSGVVQTKKEMIYHVLFAPNPFKSREVSEDSAPDNPKLLGNIGVVTSILTTTRTAEDGKDISERFRNIKIFKKHSGRWLCTAWQVFRDN
jgi:hypothetical protein